MKKPENINNYIRKLFSDKTISNNKYNKAYSLLDTIANNKQYSEYYNNTMGKLLLKQNDVISSREFFLRQLDINPNSSSAYYNLYKISVISKEYIDAYLYLQKYEELIKNYDPNVNVSLPLYSLEIIIDFYLNTKYFFDNNHKAYSNNKFNLVTIDNESANHFYDMVVKNFNTGNYSLMAKKIASLNDEVEKNNINIEVHTLARLASELEKIYLKKNTSNYNQFALDGTIDLKKESIMI